MTDFFLSVLKSSLQGSIVILAVAVLRLLLKKAPKSLFCLLWLLAGLRLVVPFEIQSSLSLQPQLEDTGLTIQAEQTIQVPEILIREPQSHPAEIPAVPEQIPNLPEENRSEFRTESFLYHMQDGNLTGPVSYGDLAARIWGLGMATMLCASAVSYLKLKRRVREAYLVDKGCFECPGLKTAFVLGFLPPKIYLPSGLTRQEQDFIYAHENTHIARHDHWYKLFGYLVLSLHWFNPLVWLGYCLLCQDLELACDEHVIRNMSLPERKAYSAALLSCSGTTGRITACPVAFGESNPKKRILNVLNYRKPGFWVGLLAVLAVSFVCVCLLTSPAGAQLSESPELLWNLEMNAAEVSPTGAKVEFIQSGSFPGSEESRLQHHSAYTLQIFRNDQWEDLEILSAEESATLNLVAVPIKLNQTTTCHLNWNLRYGQLAPGTYRICMGITLFQSMEDRETNTFYAEFTIQDVTPTEPAGLILRPIQEQEITRCREAMNALKNSPSLYLYIVNAYDPNDVINTYMRCPEGWLFQYRRPGWDYQAVSWLCYGDEQYLFTGESNDDGVLSTPYRWQVAENPQSQIFQLPYPFDLDWSTIQLNCTDYREENREVSITLNFPDYLDEFTFRFDESGELNWFTIGDSTDEPEATTTRVYVRYPWSGTVEEELERLYKTASAMAGLEAEPYNERFYRDLFTRETDGSGTSMWISELFDVFYQDPEIFTARLDDFLRSQPEIVAEVLNCMDSELENHAPYQFEYILTHFPEGYYSEMKELLLGITGRNLQEQKNEIDQLIYENAQLAKCNTALTEYRSRGCWSLVENNSFSGGDVLNATSNTCWYILGNNYLCQSSIPEDGGASEFWDLSMGGSCYHRQGFTPAGPEFGTGWQSDWNTGLTNNAYFLPMPWPLRFDWANASLTYMETQQDEAGESITFSTLGDPTGLTHEVQKYTVKIRLDNHGNLETIQLHYMLDNTVVHKQIVIRGTPREEIQATLDRHHYDACVQIMGTVEDLHEDDHDQH